MEPYKRRLYNEISHQAEECVIEILKSRGYTIRHSSPDIHSINLFARNNEHHYVIQIKTDVKRDGMFPETDKDEIADLLEVTKTSKIVPVLIHCYIRRRMIVGVNLTNNAIIAF